MVKKRRRSIRMPAAKIAQPMPAATSRPANAARSVWTTGPLDAPMAYRNRTVSSPSRATEMKARPASASDRAAGQGDVHAALELALHRPALATHPEQHPGQDDDRDERGETLDALLDDERQAPDGRDDREADDDRQGDRGADPDPDAAQRVAPVELDQVGADDADDEGGFQPFAERDEERGGHGRCLPGFVWCTGTGSARLHDSVTQGRLPNGI